MGWQTTQSGLLFISGKSCTGTQAQFIYVVFILPWQSTADARETMWPTKLEVFTIWPYIKKSLPTPNI